MGSPMTLSHLTLSGLERSNSRSLRFRSLISCKGLLGHMLLWNKSVENCHLSHRLQVSSRQPRSMDLLLFHTRSTPKSTVKTETEEDRAGTFVWVIYLWRPFWLSYYTGSYRTKEYGGRHSYPRFRSYCQFIVWEGLNSKRNGKLSAQNSCHDHILLSYNWHHLSPSWQDRSLYGIGLHMGIKRSATWPL